MHLQRREFLQYSALFGALATTSSLACVSSGEVRPPKQLSILILGGTGFLGPAIVAAAEPRGHKITLFNRGKTNPSLFPQLEKLQGDRDPNKGEGIKALGGRKWDVVFDDCGYYPRMVKASADLLAPNIGHYVYISSISCYARNDIEGADETAECGTMPDPTLEKMGANYEYYGPLKALCEQAVQATMPERACIVRPGYIVGPGDPTDRFTYWPVRADKGGEFLVPGAPSDPLQVIDVRDLAEWLVLCAERRTMGVFNACGPEKKLEWGKVIDASVKCASTKAVPRWASLDVLAKYPDAQFHIWAPYAGESKGFHTASNARAVAAGMKFRAIDTIVADTLAWFKTLPDERRAQLSKRSEPMLSAAREAEIIAALG